jgi:anti-anti-sigma factor
MESAYAVHYQDGTAKVTLAGRLDAANAPGLQEELKKLVGQKVAKLVFFAKDLEYISSAGLRVIIFAKQKIGVDAHLYLIAAGETVLSVIKMSGLDNFVTVQDAWVE